VQICVEGPSGVTVKKWNVDSSMTFSSRRLLTSGRDAARLVCISDSTTLTEWLAEQNQSVEVSGAVPHIENGHRDISIFFGNITTFRQYSGAGNERSRTKQNGNWLELPALHRYSFQAQ
jgi:hypothetical protein